MAEILTPKLAPLATSATTAKAGAPFIEIEDVSLFYGASKALKNISVKLEEKLVTAFIGPSGCGKSTLLRCLNRMNDLIDNVRIDGAIKIGGHDIYASDVDVIELRKRVGMVFQKSNPFPKSIYENVAYGLRLHGVKAKSDLDSRIEESLQQSALWDEVKDRLHSSALGLSGGQQQRLCIARAIVNRPSILLADEPTGNLDSAYAQDILAIFKSFHQVGVTLLISTHNESMLQDTQVRVLTLKQGELLPAASLDTAAPATSTSSAQAASTGSGQA
jgi:phosphate transport system ATP-binding protein